MPIYEQSVNVRKTGPVWWYATWRIVARYVGIAAVLTTCRIAAIGNLWYKFVPKGYTLRNLYKISLGEEVPGTHPHAKFYRFGFLNVGLQPEKSLKLVIFGKYLPQRGISPLSIFTKFGVGEGLLSPRNHAYFHLRGFKNVALRPPKSQKIAIFGINLPLTKNPEVP